MGLKPWVQSQLSEMEGKLKKVDTSNQKISRERPEQLTQTWEVPNATNPNSRKVGSWQLADGFRLVTSG